MVITVIIWVQTVEIICGLFAVKIAEDIIFRSTMGNDRLNGLALMLIHRNVELNPDAVVEEFSRRYPLRLLLINLFSE